MFIVVLAGCPAWKNNPPIASGVAIVGEAKAGSVVSGQYIFEDPNNDPEGPSKYRWLRSDSPSNFDAVEIPDEDALQYTLTNSDAGFFIFFEVTPVDIKGLAGNPVLSDPFGPVSGSPAISIVDSVLESNSSDQSITILGHFLYDIWAAQIVLEYDSDFLKLGAANVSSDADLQIVLHHENRIIDISIAWIDEATICDAPLVILTFDTGNAVGTTYVDFAEYSIDLHTQKTSVVPDTEIDLTDRGIFYVQ